ncbi:MAG: UvrD-helicase domain-containing protein [Cytophagales bacterium]|nr:UvrD-helicase domain-containing protein [Cytophagales bacterium]
MSDGLNVAQRDAVNFLAGPSLVLAGAGSGKTRVITHKIARLIEAGLEPKRIAAITFTNKAAAEMRERAKAILQTKSMGKAAKELTICTFHALGVRMLRQDGAVLGLKPNFSILDASDVESMLKDAGGTVDAATARGWQWTISGWKSAGLTGDTALSAAKNEDERVCAIIMQKYEERLSAYQSVDFDDLIGLPLKLLRDFPEVRAKWQAAFGHVLVDEYQDTNEIQYEMLKLLVGERARFTAVGDDDQSIYGWRGATLDNLRRLPADYPNLKVIPLEQNYRSTPQILQAANNVISNNPKLFPKKLWSDIQAGEPVRVVDADNEEHEAERIVARIQSLRAAEDSIAAHPKDYKDFAVLYRANHLAKAFEKALRKAAIPYKVSGGMSFFDRAEIKDLCSWLRLLSNNDDDPAFIRAVSTPKRGIGHITLATLGNYASSYKVSLFEALFSPPLGSALSTRALDGLQEFGRYLNDLEFRARQTSGAEDAKAFLLEWLKDIGYEKHLMESAETEKLSAAKWANVLDFVDWMSKRCGGEIDDTAGVTLVSESKTLLEVIQNVSLLSTLSERESEQNVVTLSTLHAAKGLEWPHVMLAGVTEGSLPFSRNVKKPKNADRAEPVEAQDEEDFDKLSPNGKSTDEINRLQEERRLMYVGITRARNTLMVSWTKKKKAGRDMVSSQPSRFIAEMALDVQTIREDPMAKLKALRAEFAKKAADSAAQSAAQTA